MIYSKYICNNAVKVALPYRDHHHRDIAVVTASYSRSAVGFTLSMRSEGTVDFIIGRRRLY